MLGDWLVIVSSVESARRIFSDPVLFPKNIFATNRPNNLFSKFLGVNVIFSNGELWKRHRKVVSPPFKRAFDPSIFGQLCLSLINLIDKQGEVVNIHPLIQKLTIDALGKALMGLNFDSLNKNVPFIEDYNTVMNSFNPILIIFPLLESTIFPMRKASHDALDSLDAYFKEVIEERRHFLENNLNTDKNDLLTLMIRAKEGGFNDKELRDNLMGFILAGQDTTAFTLSATLFQLAKFEEIQVHLREEIFKVLGESSEITIPNDSQLREMPYLTAVIKETMRLYPSVARLPIRLCSEDIEMEGFLIPKGTKISLEIFQLHRDPNYSKDPNTFNPSRFIENESIMDPFAWCPFGGGSRSCLGTNFSLFEQKVILVMIIQKYFIKLPANAPRDLKLKATSLLSPDNLYLNFTQRK